jgi:hypothetical protein
MIEVIDEKPDPSVKRKVVCRKCGVKLEYVPLDIRKSVHTDYSGTSDEYFWIDCPRCKEANEVKRP